MALNIAGVTASFLGLPTSLLTCFSHVFTFARPMTLLTTEVRSTLQLLTTHFATADLIQPARLVFERFLPTQARFL